MVFSLLEILFYSLLFRINSFFYQILAVHQLAVANEGHDICACDIFTHVDCNFRSFHIQNRFPDMIFRLFHIIFFCSPSLGFKL